MSEPVVWWAVDYFAKRAAYVGEAPAGEPPRSEHVRAAAMRLGGGAIYRLERVAPWERGEAGWRVVG